MGSRHQGTSWEDVRKPMRQSVCDDCPSNQDWPLQGARGLMALTLLEPLSPFSVPQTYHHNSVNGLGWRPG